MVESAELRKRERENKTEGNFSLITRSYFRLPFTYASSLLFASPEQAKLNVA